MTPASSLAVRMPNHQTQDTESAPPSSYTSCPFPPLHLTASTAIASVLAGATVGVLAYASGMDAAIAMLTGIAVFAGGSLLWLAENFSLMRQQQFMHATMQHVIFNGVHTAVSGLAGSLPASLGAQQLAMHLSSPPATVANAASIAGAQETVAPEISPAGFALLLGAVALPTFVSASRRALCFRSRNKFLPPPKAIWKHNLP